MQKAGPHGTNTVPVPDHRELRTGTLMAIIRQSGVPRSEFECGPLTTPRTRRDILPQVRRGARHPRRPGRQHTDSEEGFRASERRSRRALEERDTARVLRLVFDRLHVLRNRIVHRGVTWNSRVNRDQVRDGAAILAFLMPIFVDVMMDNPRKDWGHPFYPVVE